MSLNPAQQFNEAGTSAADFDPQDKVLPNSPILSADVNTIAERALRRTRYLLNTKADLAGATFTGPVVFDDTIECNSTAQFDGVVTANDQVVINNSLEVTGDVELGGAINFASPPRTYVRSVKGSIVFDPSEWGPGVNAFSFRQHTPPNAGGIQTPVSWVLDVPPGSTITGVTWLIDPAGGHGALPGILPSMSVVEQNPATGATTTIANMPDVSPDVATYEPAHTISSAVLSYTTTEGRLVLAMMTGEKGSNEVAGAVFYAPVATFTRTSNVEA